MWRALVARIVPAPRRDGIPSDWNFSRLVANVVELEGERGLAGGMMDTLRRRLTEALPDYGEHLGCDGKAIGSHSTGHRDRRTGKTSDADANWGRHETRGVDGNGKAWRKVKTWFGCGLHLIADSRLYLPVEAPPCSRVQGPIHGVRSGPGCPDAQPTGARGIGFEIQTNQKGASKDAPF